MYIYCPPQTDCFVLSELFSVTRHVGRSKPGSKPIQLYVRLSLTPLGQQAYHVRQTDFLRYLSSNSSSRLFTFLIPYRLPECSILSKSFALRERRPTIPSPYIYIYKWQKNKMNQIGWKIKGIKYLDVDKKNHPD